MPAILFGSISTVSDTSELQRQAFNDAFAEHDLDWNWTVEDYRALLTSNGGAARIADYAAQRDQDVDAQAVHTSKSARFQQLLAERGAAVRPGVAQTLDEARQAGWKVGLVTTTSPDNVDALLAALAPDVTRAHFDVIVDSTDVAEPKPDPEAYEYALAMLDESAAACVAVEDNVGGLAAAQAAGVTCLAFPNSNTAGHDFGGAEQVDELTFGHLSAVVAAE